MQQTVNFLLVSVFSLFLSGSPQAQNVASNSLPISHVLFDDLLKKHVNEKGLVNYKGFREDSVLFKEYLDLLSNNHPNDKNWSRDERLAYWINAYNAFTIQLILKYYPVKSIKDIKKGIPFVSDTWTIDFIKIEGKKYDLNNIEHGIVRPKFNEPRIHFALNCASIGCPPLLNAAYTAEKLNTQLDDQARRFINNGFHNKFISANKAEVSKLFTWFAGDFKKTAPSVIAFINKYAKTKLSASANLDYMDYDWRLNEAKN
jgi:Protein of unknown function, DUF547